MYSNHTDSVLKKTFAPHTKIVLIGSATGGHVMPIIALTKRLPDNTYIYLVSPASLELSEAKKNNIPYKIAPIRRLRSTHTWAKCVYITKLIPLFSWSLFTLWSLKKNGYKTLFSKGGPGSLPISIAAKVLGFHIVIHESDVVPGSMNRLMAHFADTTLIGFEQARSYFRGPSILLCGQILDPVFDHPPKANNTHSWNTSSLHILVICGSQGSRSIFQELAASMHQGEHKGEYKIVLGTLNKDMRDLFTPFPHVELIDWITSQELASILADTDIVITRGSATTLAEVSKSLAHMIIIPLPSAANNHQFFNARIYEGMGHTLLPELELHKLRKEIDRGTIREKISHNHLSSLSHP